MTRPVIEVRGLGKRYRLGTMPGLGRRLVSLLKRSGDMTASDFWALRDVHFDVDEGEVIGVIGRNGAGKSTLLKVLSRITYPTVGQAVIRGRLASLLEVGTGFHPELSGRENIYLNGTILGMRKAEIDRQFDAIVDFSGVERFLDTPVKRYSSGMYVRLAFAVAAHLEPEILVVDEVLAVGDAEFQKKCLGKMSDVARRGRTVLFVSHNMSAVQALTQRCVWLAQGSAVGVGPTPEVVSDYLNSMTGSSTVDVTDAPRDQPHHASRVRLRRISALMPGGFGFPFNDELLFEIELESYAAHSGLRFGLTVRDASGAPVLSSITPPAVSTVDGETSVHQLSLSDTRLAPGSYTVGLSVCAGGAEEGRDLLDVVQDGPMFAVCSIGRQGDQVFNWRPEYGRIVHPSAVVTRLPSRPVEAAA